MGTVDEDDEDSWRLEQFKSLFTSQELRPAPVQGMSSKLLWRPSEDWPTTICVAVVFRQGDYIWYDPLDAEDVDTLNLTPEQKADLLYRLDSQRTAFGMRAGSLPGLTETQREITGGDSPEEIIASLWDDGPFGPKAKGRAARKSDPALADPIQREPTRITVGTSDGIDPASTGTGRERADSADD